MPPPHDGAAALAPDPSVSVGSPRAMASAIALGYALAGGAWILLSDSLTSILLSSRDQLYAANVGKGMFFVVVTASLLFLLLSRTFSRLARRHAEIASMSDGAHDLISIFDTGLRFLYVNPAACRATGYSLKELLATPVPMVLGEEGRALLPSHLARLDQGTYSRDVWPIRRKDGSVFTAEFCSQRLPDGRYLAIGHDITDRLLAERELLERLSVQDRMAKVAASVPGVVCSLRLAPDGRLTFPFASESMTDFSGVTPGQAAEDGRIVFANTHPDDVEALMRSIAESAKKVSAWTGEWRYLHPSKGLRWMQGRSMPQQDLDGSIVWHGYIEDITERREAEAALRIGNEFNRAILDSAVSQVAVLDNNGDIVAVNEAWKHFAADGADCNVRGRRSQVGANLLQICRTASGPGAERAAAFASGILDVLNGNAPRFSTDWPCNTGNGLRWYCVNVTPLANGTSGAVVSCFDITDIRQAHALQDQAARELKALAKKQIAILEEERHAISLEIHDHIGQSLTAIRLNLASAEGQISDQPERALAKIRAANQIADDLIVASRDLSRRLRPPMIDDLGLAAAIRWHVARIRVPDAIRIALEDGIDAARFPVAVEVAGFRVVQEAITNSLRHAKPTRIQVGLNRTRDRLVVTVQDDGVGFDWPADVLGDGPLPSLGLIGMRERVEARGGCFSVDTRNGTGTKITASFPVAPES